MRRIALLSVLMVVAATGGCHKQEAPPSQAQQTTPPAATAAPTPPPAAGPTVVTTGKGKSAPDAKFTDLAGGAEKSIADFKGRPLLVNLWATWCMPCVKELPMLAKLAGAAPGGLQVVAISQDMQGATVVGPFLKNKGLALHPYHDRDNALMLALKESALPVSILFDAQGKEVWRISGDLDWTSARASALLAQAGS